MSHLNPDSMNLKEKNPIKAKTSIPKIFEGVAWDNKLTPRDKISPLLSPIVLR